MRLLILLFFVVSCASFHNETIQEQNDKVLEYNSNADRISRLGPNKW